MNRRDAMKGVAVSLAAMSAGYPYASISSAAQNRKNITPVPSDVHVIFHGLWAFWYSQAYTDDSGNTGSEKGILAFTPQTDHEYWAMFCKPNLAPPHKWSSPFMLDAGVPYQVSFDQPMQNPSPWGAATSGNAGLFLYTSGAPSGKITIMPPQIDSTVRKIWLPYPYDIVPFARVHSSFFDTSGDYSQLDLRQYWPMVRVFCYAGPTKTSLNDGLGSVSGQQNLHIFAQPPMAICDKGQHAWGAFDSLVSMIKKSDGSSLALELKLPVPMLNPSNDSVPGIGSSEIDTSNPCLRAKVYHSSMTRKLSAREAIESGNPSNCAGGTGMDVGP